MAIEAPVNGVGTTLAAAITSTTATTCSLASATGFTNAQYHCLISDGTNFEIVTATGLSGTTLTIVRASESYAGSVTPHTFGVGSSITVVPTIGSVNGLIQAALPNNPMTWTRATGAPWSTGASYDVAWGTLAITTANVGDVVIVGLLNSGNPPSTINVMYSSQPSAIYDSAGYIAWDTQPIVPPQINITDGSMMSLWKGVVVSTGATNIGLRAPATAPYFYRIVADEWTPSIAGIYSLGVGKNMLPVWAQHDTSDSPATTSVTMPALTAPPAGGLYLAWEFISGTGSAGSTAGFNYYVTTGTNLWVTNGSLTPGSTYQPTATMTSGYTGGQAIILVAQ